mmetsp:Transcript_28164/g.77416  ORF Transcript_28164/g.77416 Transcript_28164/m.77416 type:complete len:246 (-) Transcript_28164:80-817(-)
MLTGSFARFSILTIAVLAATSVEAFLPAINQPRSTTNLGATGQDDNQKTLRDAVQATLLGLTIAASAASFPQSALADGQTKEFRLPPIDFADQSRCVLKSSSIGQANAARDKLYDLRLCDLSGASASGFDMSGVIMSKTNLANARLEEAYFSKGYLRESNFEGADFTNAIVDRASFMGSSLRGAIFKNAVLTGTSFEGADVEGADFTEAALGSFDIRGLCKNPTLKGENPKTGADTRETVGCGGN